MTITPPSAPDTAPTPEPDVTLDQNTIVPQKEQEWEWVFFSYRPKGSTSRYSKVLSTLLIVFISVMPLYIVDTWKIPTAHSLLNFIIVMGGVWILIIVGVKCSNFWQKRWKTLDTIPQPNFHHKRSPLHNFIFYFVRGIDFVLFALYFLILARNEWFALSSWEGFFVAISIILAIRIIPWIVLTILEKRGIVCKNPLYKVLNVK